MPLRNMYTGDGAVVVTTMVSLVVPLVVFVTACGAAGWCGVVRLTAPLCSSIYTLRILIVLISIYSTLIHVHWGWGCRCDDYVVACGASGCNCGWSSLFQLMPLRNMYTGDGAVVVTTMVSLVVPLVVFVTACGTTGRCGVVTLTAPLCFSVYTLRKLIVLISIDATPK